MNWLPYSIVATLSLGISMSLYKLPSFKGYSSFVSTFWSNVFAVGFVALAMVLFTPGKLDIVGTVSWYALLWGAFFAGNMILLKILLQDVETVAAYPVTSSLSSVLTVLIGIIVLSERLSLLQAIGTCIIIASVYAFTRKGGSFRLHRKSVLLLLGILATSTASKYVQKLGAVHEPIERFMAWQYIGAALFALAAIFLFEPASLKAIIRPGNALRGSLLIGLFTAAGGYAIFKALAIGPLSGVYAIHPSYTFVAALVGWALFKERLTIKKIALALASVAGIVLIKIG